VSAASRPAVVAVPAHGAATDPEWWRHGVVYQVYPRSFADSNGDGIGDLPGIIAHLDHLAGAGDSLGVDAIWLSPIYPSPGLDVGYDVADHSAIDPVFGTMADFDRLVAEAHRRGLKVILDLVLNHTSDQHAWFADSRRSRDNEHADWYLWRDPAGVDGRGRPLPPNNWVSYFGGSAWTWEPAREQFYMHTFLAEQPEVNWRHPALRAAQLDVVRGWLARGVDGFRLDVFNSFLKAESFASNPARPGLHRNPWDRQEHRYDKDQPDFPELLAEFRAVLDAEPGRFSVGELFASELERAAEYTSGHHLAFDFGLIQTPWSAEAMGREIDRREAAYGPDRWPAVVLSNHDQSRHVTRFARSLGVHDEATMDRVARAAAVLLLTLRGTPFLYYGEEIGLPDVAVPKAEIIDPPARRASLLFPWWNRDQCRSPLPWTGGPHGGFTTGRPWLRMIPDVAHRNVSAQAGVAGSVFETYRRLLAVRRRSRALNGGSFRRVDPGTHDVVAWVREVEGESAVVVINFGFEPRRVVLPPGAWQTLFDTAELPADSVVTGGLAGGLVLDGLQAMVLGAVTG
jgi:alpha-glucosidase